MFRNIWIVLALAAGVAARAAEEAPVDAGSTNATRITSKKLTFDYQNRFAIFEQDVVVTDPEVRITADRMTVVFDKENSPDKIIAIGRVRIEQTDRTARCERAVYQVKQGRLDLTGDPILRRGQDTLKGRVITFWKNQDRVEGEDVHLELSSEADQGLKLLKGD